MENEYNNINYSFHVQSVEDFYNQLRVYNILDISNEQEIDVSECNEAKQMLNKIGVNV